GRVGRRQLIGQPPMNQFRRRLFPSCAFRSRISPSFFASFEKLADFAANFSPSFEKLAISRRVFSGRLKGSQISRISQISRGVFRLADFARNFRVRGFSAFAPILFLNYYFRETIIILI
ncbi:hypothetical protein, partial [Prevotellamassilia timonensis]|uniref:hypothetical protein n=1 Tax=Prevotellamassilia timonensis TaxID=1852370 RepID=UPI001F256671